MVFSRIVRTSSTGSTNADVLAGLTSTPDAWPHLSVLVAAAQTAGRGRAGHTWTTPPGRALTCTVVLRPDDAAARPVTWLPLLAGLAVRQAIAPWVPAGLKWPNDVVGKDVNPAPGWGWGSKLAGILSELHPSGAVAVGIGVNCLQPPGELPVPWAGSLAGELAAGRGAPGADGRPEPTPEAVLGRLGEAFAEFWELDQAALQRAYAAACVTLGQRVRAQLPDGGEIEGMATGVTPLGALELRGAAGPQVIVAAEVRAVRPAR